ncbi:HAD family hydrolase [Nonomuraea diastatica]|uniref:HAD family hydrolase n=1 Tax=Nonomuraea diastatica TaxID=1848329 RepID=UPI00140E806D|nr:HAD hydrolase-like protein [Nonomuraea diastatica]
MPLSVTRRTGIPSTPTARERVHLKSGLVYTPYTTVLIGDTPHDVSAGRNSGAHVIGIASGKSSTSDLRGAGANIVFSDLTDSAALIRAITA